MGFAINLIKVVWDMRLLVVNQVVMLSWQLRD